ncbi:uracil-DNA glycosylase [Sphingomonas sp. HMP6]|uniref:uracil-DNA glycosylase n=1 Tax=Sphingomonas sp. HMP6 TaxID=1517551 RepID=UPI0015964015|nr:uracil-DNA glycosylase [Sphingomonas sp. HMP6]BCA58204.1 uracil-DNA glycosylase [Sphingomonas sp. HMP6]
MGADQNFDWQLAAASALEWWRDAGVDTLVDEGPRDWTAAPPAPPEPPKRRSGAQAVTEVVVAALPETLAEFTAWRSGPDAPEAGWSGTPIAASGDPSADIMILVDLPDRDDSDSGGLLSGPAGRLFDRMFAAIGQSRESVYLAPMCSVRPLSGRIAPEIEARLVEVARHHVALVSPKRLLVLGNAPSRALTGVDVARARGSLHAINLDCRKTIATVDVVASFHPRLLLERPAEKARAWKDLQMLIAGLRA